MNDPTNGLGIVSLQPGTSRVEGDTIRTATLFELPSGREAYVTTRADAGSGDAELHRQEFLETVYPPSLTDGLAKEIQKLEAAWNDFTGYSKEGKPLMRVVGRERDLLEMRLATRRNALASASKVRLHAERVQAEMSRAKVAMQARIESAAQVQAQQLIEQAQIDRRAKQIAARAGVND